MPISTSSLPQPPVAAVKPRLLQAHGHTRTDDYYWLNERENPEVLDYLQSENDYYEACTAHLAESREILFQEMKARIKEDDSSVPFFYNGYYYITRFEKGRNYPVYSRKKGSETAPEEILFDCNAMSEGHAYFNLGHFSVSPDNTLALFSTDIVGRRIYSIRIKNLITGEIYKDELHHTSGNAVWANDNKTLFYTVTDAVTLRSYRIYRHVLGTPVEEDQLVYEEHDDAFHIDIHKSKSRKYLFIDCDSTLTTETLLLEADTPQNNFRVFSKRKRGVEYSVSHYGDHFYIRTNKDGATNFKLMKTQEKATASRNWVEVLPHRSDVLLEDVEIFRDFLVVEERSNGLNHIRIMPWTGDGEHYLPFQSETYTAGVLTNPDFDTDWLRYSYQSLATPSSVIDFNMRTGERIVRKEQEVLGEAFRKENYTEVRLWATADDGVRVPMSVVYRTDLRKEGGNPVLLYAYGSYGLTIDAHFSSTRLSLLDRGFIFAIAHVRGGEDLGREWYESGKMLNKINTFTDYIACARHLIDQKYTTPRHLYGEGGSAGGLLMGAVANMAPELFNGLLAQVPFVDVVTTMLDETIPLTTGEYDEWGNPNEKEYYEYMLSYSPYDNVKAEHYPNMLITTGLHDSQVQYWEPAKWVAKLRKMKTDSNLLYLYTNLDAGHGGASGRFEALRELAREFSFFLELENIKVV